ncbi:hypothetical protein B0H11DRAFT_2229534 [Mycena galericulata]|nr:hypothetical protein B0H11DRAFT_2229534 [Mycena galericulata]
MLLLSADSDSLKFDLRMFNAEVKSGLGMNNNLYAPHPSQQLEGEVMSQWAGGRGYRGPFSNSSPRGSALVQLAASTLGAES